MRFNYMSANPHDNWAVFDIDFSLYPKNVKIDAFCFRGDLVDTLTEYSLNESSMLTSTNHILRRKRFLGTLSAGLSICFLSQVQAAEENAEKKEEKNPEDPTKIVTRLGAGYNGDFTINGSWGLDKTRMISGFINSDASEWRLGGSWLFKKGILNFNFKKNQYDSGGDSVSYNIGTYIPLSVFGFKPCGWMLFPSFGVNYTQGNILVASDSHFQETPFSVPIDSKGVYLGGFGLKPINDQWTVMVGLGGSYGSGDTTNIYAGTGISWRMTEQQSLNLFYSVSDSSQFGGRNTLSVNYRFEFK